MKIEHILDNHHVKRALQVALVGEHSVYLNLPDNDNYSEDDYINAYSTAFKFHEWGTDHNLIITIGYDNDMKREYDIVVDVVAPHSKVASKWDEPEEKVLERVKNADSLLHYFNDNLDDTTIRLLESATKTLSLSSNDVKNIISVAVSVSRLSHDTLKAIYVAEALQYWD